MMKNILTIGCLMIVPVAFAEATVDKVLVRQQWPWSREVRVDYEVSGAEGAGVDLAVEVRAGDLTLDTAAIVQATVKGGIHGVKNGYGFFAFDPQKAFGNALPSREISVKLTVDKAADPLVDRVEYRVFDLENGTVTDLRRRDFYDRPGIYGTFTTDYSTIGPDFVSSLPAEENFIWTGVNQGTEYKTSKLVMKRIPARGKVWWMGPTDDDAMANRQGTYLETRFQVKHTKDFFLGVFELTTRQHELVTGVDPCFFTNQTHHARAPVHHINMHTVMFDETGFCKMASAKFGKKIRFPYEAEWEFAAKAGYDGPNYPNGKAVNSANFGELEGYTSGSGSTDRNSPYFPYEAGKGRPNPFGLYNMYGNVRECMGDPVQKDLLAYYETTCKLVQPFVNPYTTSQNVGAEAYPYKGCDFNKVEEFKPSRPSARKGYVPSQFYNEAGCPGVFGCRVMCECD